MKKISFFLFFLTVFFSYAQTKDKISIKQQNQIFFYRMGEYKDSTIIQDSSDVFLIKMSSDKKACTEIKLKNATFIKTTDEHIFKLVYTPGMKYRMVYAANAQETASGIEKNKFSYKSPNEKPLEARVATDGATSDNSKEIVIQLVNTKTEKVLLTNVFYYRKK